MIKIFEAFAGIGSQIKAFKNIDIEIKSDISEWNINSIIAYYLLNNNDNVDLELEKIKKIDKKTKLNYLAKFSLSLDSITKTNLKRINNKKLDYLYLSMQKLNNYADIKEVKGKELGIYDMFIYSFPCQDLSLAGKNLGIKNGTKSGLLLEVQRILQELKELNKLPKYLLMENVSNILSKKHLPDFLEFQKFLESLGYYNNVFNLNSKEIGIPQNRKRTFMLSSLNKKNIINIKKLDKCQNLGTFLNWNKKLLYNKNYENEAKKTLLKDTKSRHNYIIKSKKENRILKFDSYAYTITTKQDRFPNSGLIPFFENTNGYLDYRFLTAREQTLLMGYTNEDYEKLAKVFSKNEIEKMIGNSIVVKKLELIFKEVFKTNSVNNTNSISNKLVA